MTGTWRVVCCLLLTMTALVEINQAAVAGIITVESTGVQDVWTTVVPNSGSGAVRVEVSSPPGVPVYTGRVNGVLTPTIPAAPITVKSDPFGFFSRVYTAGRALTAPAKAAGQIYDIQGNVVGAGGASAFAEANMTVRAAEVILSTTARVVISNYAVAEAEDPLDFSAGANTFTHIFGDLLLTCDAPSCSAGYIASANSTSPGYENLFTMEVYARRSTSGPLEILIGFQSNPLLGLNDSAVVSQFASSLTVSGSTVSLDSPVSLSYAVNSATGYEFSVTSTSVAEAAVPEPSTIVQGGVAALCCTMYWLRRRRRAGNSGHWVSRIV